jgi:hypothetical protein
MTEDETKQSSERDSSEPAEPGRERLGTLLRRADELKMDPERLLPYAQLLVAAQDQHAAERASAEHARRARAEIMGLMLDFSGGYDQPEEAIRREHKGRETRQQFYQLVEAAAHAIRKAEAFYGEHTDQLTKGLRVNYPRELITQDRVFWTRLATDANPSNSFYQREEPTPKFVSVSRLVLTSWRHLVPDYDGKWQDMYALARLWHISNSQDLEYFRRYVMRITKITRE